MKPKARVRKGNVSKKTKKQPEPSTAIADNPEERDAQTRFEDSILKETRELLNNKSVTVHNWSSWENSLRATAKPDQILVPLRKCGVFVVVNKSDDKR